MLFNLCLYDDNSCFFPCRGSDIILIYLYVVDCRPLVQI